LNTSTTSYVVLAEYDEESKKITSKDLINFETFYTDKVINSIVDIYPMNKMIMTQVYNSTDNLYQVKGFKLPDDEEGEIVKSDIDICDSNSISEY
jgi:hypothetical protein